MPENNTTTRHFFSIENPKKVTNTTQHFGVLNSQLSSTDIPDNVTERGAGLGKLASSMPTAMARLFIFDSALKQVNAYQGENPQNGQIGVLNQSTGDIEPTPYHELVGEMLDMLEFIYEYGDDDNFHVHRWDMSSQSKLLKNSEYKVELPDGRLEYPHARLAEALEASLSVTGLNQNPSIYLFLWGNDVIGGSSPMSLVYTSANLYSRIESGQLKFQGKAGNRLFAGTATPLHKRDQKFRDYIYRIWQLYVNTNPSLKNLATYIKDSANSYESQGMILSIRTTPNAFTGVKDLESQGNTVQIAGVPMKVSDHTITIDETTTDYMLKPTTDYYKKNNSSVRTPLALTPQGLDNAIYAAERNWNQNSDVIPVVLPPLEDRILPGLKVAYPFLTTKDFLEDRIIEVSYNIDRKNFFTGSQKKISFLLPLKKEFFQYFKLEDLFKVDEKSGTVTYTDMLSIEYKEATETVIVKLNLPLTSGKKITFFKKYDVRQEGGVDKLNCYDGESTFDIAIFPFYRLDPDDGNNVYNVMVGVTADSVETKYWTPDVKEGLLEVDSTTHHRLTGQGIKTDHVNVEGAFVCMELKVVSGNEEATALVVPIFKTVSSNSADAENIYTFGVDFGTTNTHLAYASRPVGEPIGKIDVKPFDYDSHDTQIVMLNDEDGVVEFGAFTTAVKRELVPFAIGASGEVKFPMRTTTYQKKGTPATLELFTNTNIGFNYGSDISNTKNYKSNIKWERSDGLSRQRMATFFEQLLWMMKNKSVLNDCSDSFNVIITYPIAMREEDLSRFKSAWNDAMKKVKCNINKLTYLTESIAPYYAKDKNSKSDKPFANVDVGGGTTDILYVNPNTQEAQVYSAFFAANDLWNDGMDPSVKSLKENGFVTFFKGVRLNKLGDKQAQVNDMISNAASSADIISYLFANDSWTLLSERIEASAIMKQLPIVHFSALIFYLAYVVHMSEVNPPVYLTFSGMGSKYIKLINPSDNQIAKLVNEIFHYAGSKEVLDNPQLSKASIEVSFQAEPKEITAVGALVSLNHKSPIYPVENIFHGYEGENPEKSFRIRQLNDEIKIKVQRFFRLFLGMFKQPEMADVLSDIGCPVSSKVLNLLEENLQSSFKEACRSATEDVEEGKKLTEPMFFWPLKNSLYNIGKVLAPEAIQKLQS